MTDDLNLNHLIRVQCERTLAAYDGHVRPAAVSLGVGYATLYRWIKQWKREDRAREREAKRTAATAEGGSR